MNDILNNDKTLTWLIGDAWYFCQSIYSFAPDPWFPKSSIYTKHMCHTLWISWSERYMKMLILFTCIFRASFSPLNGNLFPSKITTKIVTPHTKLFSIYISVNYAIFTQQCTRTFEQHFTISNHGYGNLIHVL